MKYISEKVFNSIDFKWDELIDVIQNTVKIKSQSDYAQPIKPYLRFRDMTNRIIAMPAYVGGEVDACGIKWIASFPDNIKCNKKRANSVSVLNNTNTGEVEAIINTSAISAVRTAAITGFVLRQFFKTHSRKHTLGVIGLGPIGVMHLKMIESLFKDNIGAIKVFDIDKQRMNQVVEQFDLNIEGVNTWEQAYQDMDIVLTTTVAKERYIDKQPKENALLLNISLRDYKLDVYPYIKEGIIVDDWEEVCRENTDIEYFNKALGLQEDLMTTTQ